MRILLIEDDERLASGLVEALREQGLFVEHVTSEAEVRSYLETHAPTDAVVMDRLLGSFDAKALLPLLRNKRPSASILVLSAINTPNERTELLDLGADDYIGKPFATHELIARLRAAARRISKPSLQHVKVGNVILDLIGHTISVDGDVVVLPSKEFTVLRALCQQMGRVWSKNELLDFVWGQNSEAETNVVEATITNLRRRLANAGANVSIRNMRNAGYWLEE